MSCLAELLPPRHVFWAPKPKVLSLNCTRDVGYLTVPKPTCRRRICDRPLRGPVARADASPTWMRRGPALRDPAANFQI